MKSTGKYIALILAFVLSLSLVACGTDTPSDGTQSPPPANGGEQAEKLAVLDEAVTGEITVSCYDSMQGKAFLDAAARRFEELYPGTKVNVETFSAMPVVKTQDMGDGKMVSMLTMEEDPQAINDYINKVGTDLMSGNGADLYAMDVLPIHKYVSAGQLENLDEYMSSDPEFNRADYRANILDAVAFNGGTWFFPLNYSFDYYAYDTTLLNGADHGLGLDKALTLSDVLDIGSEAFSSSEAAGVLNTNGYNSWSMEGSLLGMLLDGRYSEFVDIANKTAHFDSAGFDKLLESILDYEEAGLVSESMLEEPSMEASFNAMEFGELIGELAGDRFAFKPKDATMLQFFYAKGSGLRINMMASAAATLANEEDDDIAGIAANEDGSVPFTFNQGYGINSDSKNKATSWAFLKFLLSEEMQTSSSLPMIGLPINNSARLARANNMFSGMMGGMARSAGGGTAPIGGVAVGGAPVEGSAPVMIMPLPGDGSAPQMNPGGQPSGGEAPVEGEAPEGGVFFSTTDGAAAADGEAPPDGAFFFGEGGAVGMPADVELTEEQLALIAKYIDAVERLSDQINTYTYHDTIVDEMINEEVKFFFDGTKSAVDVMNALQSKAALYLGE